MMMTSRSRQIISAPPAELWTRNGTQWKCPACGKQYPRRGQGHSCTTVSLEHHFEDRPHARELFNEFLSAIEECGPVRLSIAKSRIGIMNDLTFAAVTPRKNYLRGYCLLKRRAEHRCILSIDDGPPYLVAQVRSPK